MLPWMLPVSVGSRAVLCRSEQSSRSVWPRRRTDPPISPTRRERVRDLRRSGQFLISMDQSAARAADTIPTKECLNPETGTCPRSFPPSTTSGSAATGPPPFLANA